MGYLNLIFIIAAFFFILPYVIYPVLLRLLPEVKVRQDHQGVSFSYSLLFCAYNEENSLPAKLENIASLKKKHPDLEVLVFDDGSSDETLKLLKASHCIDVIIEGSGRSGKAAGMKQLAKAAAGQILLFTDANVILDLSAIEALGKYYSDDQIGGVCGTLHYVGENNSMTAEMNGQYWRLEEKIKVLESRSGNVMGADGSLFSVRKCLYPDFPDSVLDDFTVSMSVVFSGYRLLQAQDFTAYERLVQSSAEEWERKIRIATRAFYTHMKFGAKIRQMRLIDRWKYFCRKYVRWNGGISFMIALSSAVLLIPYVSIWTFISASASYIALALLALASFIVIGWKCRPLISAVLATQIGVFRARRGLTVQTWTPAKTR